MRQVNWVFTTGYWSLETNDTIIFNVLVVKFNTTNHHLKGCELSLKSSKNSVIEDVGVCSACLSSPIIAESRNILCESHTSIEQRNWSKLLIWKSQQKNPML